MTLREFMSLGKNDRRLLLVPVDLPGEVWVSYGPNPRYSVSNMGRFKSTYYRYSWEEAYYGAGGKLMGVVVSPCGLRTVTPKLVDSPSYCGELRPKPRYLHRIVAEHFVANPHGYPSVDFVDGDKTNCAAGNLEWRPHLELLMGERKEHWSTGSKRSAATKKKMSARKQGERHPAFRGWYVKGDGRYPSISEAHRMTGERREVIRSLHNGWSFEAKTPTPQHSNYPFHYLESF